MEEIKELLNKIITVRNERSKNVQPPADIEDIHALKLRVLEMFGFRLDSVYLDILDIWIFLK